MATFKEIAPIDIKNTKSFLNQLIDVIQEDISGSTTRKKYQLWVSGGTGPGITSSLFHTVYDQDHSLQTANPIFDMTVGLFYSSSTVQKAKTGEDSAGKLLFGSSSVMMREKVNIYRQMSQNLLGNATDQFVAPFDSSTSTDKISEALFLCFKRLFSRDSIKRETFAMRWYQSASKGDVTNGQHDPSAVGAGDGPNLKQTSESGSIIFTDIGSGKNKNVTFGGTVSSIVDSTDTSRAVGLLFYERGIAVLDLAKVISGSQKASGTIDAMNSTGLQTIGGNGTVTPQAKFIPDFMVSASVDNILDHFASTRFSSGTQTAMTFQNITNINSTLIFCKAASDEFNYSSNKTYVDSSNRINVIDVGAEESQKSFTFITTVGLYDANNNLLAVAKLSRPVEKNDEKDLTIRVRIDF